MNQVSLFIITCGNLLILLIGQTRGGMELMLQKHVQARFIPENGDQLFFLQKLRVENEQILFPFGIGLKEPVDIYIKPDHLADLAQELSLINLKHDIVYDNVMIRYKIRDKDEIEGRSRKSKKYLPTKTIAKTDIFTGLPYKIQFNFENEFYYLAHHDNSKTAVPEILSANEENPTSHFWYFDCDAAQIRCMLRPFNRPNDVVLFKQDSFNVAHYIYTGAPNVDSFVSVQKESASSNLYKLLTVDKKEIGVMRNSQNKWVVTTLVEPGKAGFKIRLIRRVGNNLAAIVKKLEHDQADIDILGQSLKGKNKMGVFTYVGYNRSPGKSTIKVDSIQEQTSILEHTLDEKISAVSTTKWEVKMPLSAILGTVGIEIPGLDIGAGIQTETETTEGSSQLTSTAEAFTTTLSHTITLEPFSAKKCTIMISYADKQRIRFKAVVVIEAKDSLIAVDPRGGKFPYTTEYVKLPLEILREEVKRQGLKYPESGHTENGITIKVGGNTLGTIRIQSITTCEDLDINDTGSICMR